MARRFSRGSRGIRPYRPASDWTASADITDYTALAAATAVLDQSFVVDGTDTETILRVRGSASFVSDQTAQTERAFGAYGFCIVSDQAFGIGVTAIPSPMADADSDLWFVHGYWYAPIAVGSSASIANISHTFEFDSKAMRKITADETLVVMVENASASHGCLFSLNARILAKDAAAG